MVELRILNKAVDLYGDESISITSKIKDPLNVDLSWTDYSQQFTVPASDRNNIIFHHYYRFNVVSGALDGFIDFRIKQRAAIDFNGSPFKTGYIKLDSISMEMDKPVNYKVTFYGSLVGLRDLIGETRLSDLNWSAYNHERTADNVNLGLGGGTSLFPSDTIIYGLISKRVRWNQDYLAGFAGQVKADEFSPMIRVDEVLKVISDTYSITFTSQFFQEPHFKRLYMVCPRELSDDEAAIAPPTDGAIYAFEPGTATGDEYEPSIYSYPLGIIDMSTFDGSTDKAAAIDIEITSTTLVNYSVEMFIDDVGYSSLPGNGADTLSFTYPKDSGGQHRIRFYISSAVVGVVTLSELIMRFTNQSNVVREVLRVSGVPTEVGPEDFVMDYAIPTMQVKDFWNNILRMFNLTVTNYNDAGEFKPKEFFVEPYDVWLAKGEVKDLTNDIDISTNNVKTSQLPAALKYNYVDPKAFLNKRFKIITAKAYGDGQVNTVGSAPIYDIGVTFENLLWEKQIESDLLHIGWLTEKAPIDPVTGDLENTTEIEDRVYLTYWTGVNNCDISIELATAAISTYKSCNSYYSEITGTPTISGTAIASINFDNEINSFTLLQETISLFSLYHKKYIDSIFHQALRYHTFKAILSAPQIMGLRLNDVIKINDLYYNINAIQSNLLTNKVNINCVNVIRGLGVLPPPVDNVPPTIGQLSVVWNPDITAPDIGVISFVSATDTTIDISWTDAVDPPPDATGIDFYQVYKDGIVTAQYAFGTNQATLTGLQPSTAYEIKMTAWDKAGPPGNESTFSNIINPSTTTNTDNIKPVWPNNPLFVTDITSTSIRLVWFPATDANGIQSYHIYQDGIEVKQEAGNVDSTLMELLTPDTPYSFKLTAKDPAGNESLFTNTQVATTNP